MTPDRFGLPVTTPSAQALTLYIDGVDRLLSANPGAGSCFREAIELDPGFALAHIALARNSQLYGLMGEARTATARAVECCARSGTARERGHIEALALAINGMPEQAMAALEAHLRDFPRDGIALSMALGVYGLIAFSGRPDHHEAQRALLERLAPYWGEDWWFLGYLGWSHVETGDPAGGAALLERSLALNPRNAHAAHARTHARVELGEASAGAAFLEAWLAGYEPAAQLHCHLNWHLALFELDLGAPERAFERYVAAMRPAITQCGPLATLADAASFLWRCGLYGVGPKDLPWAEVAALAERSFPRAGLVFADLHAAMAAAATGDAPAFERRIDALRNLDAAGKLPQGGVVPALCRGLGAYARGEYQEAATVLDAAMADLTRVAGSHAQREVFEDTLIAACLKCGRVDRARRLLAARLGRRPRVRDSAWLQAAA
jgi:tetratricopeptide (TPR) repeat protein